MVYNTFNSCNNLVLTFEYSRINAFADGTCIDGKEYNFLGNLLTSLWPYFNLILVFFCGKATILYNTFNLGYNLVLTFEYSRINALADGSCIDGTKGKPFNGNLA